MWQALMQEITSDWFTWVCVFAILTSWGFGIADIVKHGWHVKMRNKKD